MSRGAVVVSAIALAVSAAGVVAAGRVNGPVPDAVGHARTVAVSTAILACPGAPLGAHVRTTVFGATIGTRAQRGGGVLTVAPLSSAVAGPLRLTQRQRSLAIPWRTGLGAALLKGVGSLAPGAAGAQWSLSRPSASGASAATPCLPPGANWWFAGAATSAGATSRLVLTNVSSSVAVVDLAFFGPGGAVSTPGNRGVAVAPRSSKSIDLSSLAPALSTLTVSVHAVQGLVGAAVLVSRTQGVHRRGSEWLPAGALPATDVLVEPTPPTGSGKTLVITNPTSREALVRAQVIDEGGEFTPVGFTDVRLAPGSVTQLPLRREAGSSAAVQLTSTEPVVAAMVTTRHGRAADFAVTTSGPALQRPALVPVIGGSGLTLGIVSTSRPGTAVNVEALTAQGRSLDRTRIPVTGRAVSSWRLPGPAARAAYLVVSAAGGSSGLYVVAHYASRAGVTALAVRPATYTVVRPAVAATVTTP